MGFWDLDIFHLKVFENTKNINLYQIISLDHV